MKEENKNLAPTISTDSSESPVSAQKATNSNSRQILIFFAGALFATLIIGAALTLSGKSPFAENASQSKIDPKTVTPESSLPGKGRITEEDLLNNPVADDCSKTEKFAGFALIANKMIMNSIDLQGSVITVGNGPNVQYYYWRELPTVVDAKCVGLELTDIKAGDVLNVYTDRLAPANQKTKILLIQKVK